LSSKYHFGIWTIFGLFMVLVYRVRFFCDVFSSF